MLDRQRVTPNKGRIQNTPKSGLLVRLRETQSKNRTGTQHESAALGKGDMKVPGALGTMLCSGAAIGAPATPNLRWAGGRFPLAATRLDMPKNRVRNDSAEDAIDRQLRELQLELDALAASVDTAAISRIVTAPKPGGAIRDRARGVRRVRAASPTPPRAERVEPARGLAASHRPVEVVQPKAPVGAPPRGAAPPPAAKPLPTGTDLADPTQFGVMPDRARLNDEGVPRDALRQRLTADIKWAQQILHTSGVPAAVWREWRSFEQSAIARLRSLD